MRKGRETSDLKPERLTCQYNLGMTDFKKIDPAEVEARPAAMMGIVGLWKNRTDLPDTETYIRNLRKGTRLARLLAQWRSDEPDSGDEKR